MAKEPLLNDHAFRTEGLEEGALELDDRHERCDDVDHLSAELIVGRGALGWGCGCMAFAHLRWQTVPARVEADAQGVLLGEDGGGQAVGEVHWSPLSALPSADSGSRLNSASS